MNDDLSVCARALVRWRRQFESFTAPATELVVRQLPANGSVRALDLASGIGDPALALALALRGRGDVVACDAAEPFVRALAQEANARQLRNLRTCQADMLRLPLSASSFDYASMRFALHALASPQSALREVHRVLRVGGSLVCVVWGTPEQPLLHDTVVVPLRQAGGPDFVAGGPGPFRFAQTGALTEVASAAGFSHIEEVVQTALWHWPGSAASLWSALYEVSAPLYEPLLGALAPGIRAELEAGVVAALRQFESAHGTALPVQVRCLIATNR